MCLHFNFSSLSLYSYKTFTPQTFNLVFIFMISFEMITFSFKYSIFHVFLAITISFSLHLQCFWSIIFCFHSFLPPFIFFLSPSFYYLNLCLFSSPDSLFNYACSSTFFMSFFFLPFLTLVLLLFYSSLSVYLYFFFLWFFPLKMYSIVNINLEMLQIQCIFSLKYCEHKKV